MMHDAIKNFNKQLLYFPKIENEGAWGAFSRFTVVGMGGSHLAADILSVWNPNLPVFVRHNYGFPKLSGAMRKNSAVIASSYSGNTEEALSAFEEAGKEGAARAAISTGGELLRRADEERVPYIRIPDDGIQPRLAIGFMSRAILALVGEREALDEMSGLCGYFSPGSYEDGGRAIAGRISGAVPIIYASEKNASLAQNWKIKFNETGKIPSFWNTFPELNHNEMTGFDAVEKSFGLSKKFRFIFLEDESDSEKIKKRFAITAEFFRARGFSVEEVAISGKNAWEKIFSSLILGDWAAYYTAKLYGAEPEKVPMVEEFKALMKK